MSARKDVVERYVQAFRDSDHDAVLATLHDDVVWTLHGYRTLVGKDKFDTEIENPSTPAKPRLTLETLIEEGDTVVAQGRGRSRCARVVVSASSSATSTSSRAS